MTCLKISRIVLIAGFMDVTEQLIVFVTAEAIA